MMPAELLNIFGWPIVIELPPIEPTEPRELAWGFKVPELRKLCWTLPEEAMDRIWSCVGICT